MASRTRPKVSKDERGHSEGKIIRGLMKHLAEDEAIVLKGVRYTRDEMITILQKRKDAAGPVERARAAWLELVAQERKLLGETNAFVVALRQYLAIVHAHHLVDFGIEPKQRRKLTIEEKVAAHAKARATRAARRRR